MTYKCDQCGNVIRWSRSHCLTDAGQVFCAECAAARGWQGVTRVCNARDASRALNGGAA